MTEKERHRSGETPAPRKGMSLARATRSLVGRPRPMHLLMLVMFLVLGIAITTTVRAKTTDPLAALNEDQLVAILGDLDQREQALRSERSQLQTQLDELNEAVNAQEVAEEAVAQATVQAEIASGVVPVKGPGILMQVTDAPDAIPVSVFITTLAELRNAGAEAIAINDIRLNVRSWFGSTEKGEIVVNGTVIHQPYEWRGIGESTTLSMAMEIRGGAASQFRAYGARVSVTSLEEMTINSVAPPFEPTWATPTVN